MVRLPQSMIADIKRAAANMESSTGLRAGVSSVIRMACRMWLDHHGAHARRRNGKRGGRK